MTIFTPSSQGVFTPALFTQGPAIGVEYASRFGKWTKIANAVTLSAQIALASKGTGGWGAVSIGNFPFLASVLNSMAGILVADNLAHLPGFTEFGVLIDNSATFAKLVEMGGGQPITKIDYQAVEKNTLLYMTLVYFAP